MEPGHCIEAAHRAGSDFMRSHFGLIFPRPEF
jgi:hypothetical protein